VIPSVRGASRSRRAQDVLRDAARRAAQGHRELVLTGVNLGCFRDREAGVRLPELLRGVAALAGVERVRLSSIEVNHLTDALLDAIASDGRIAPHLHVPLQSGDDGVLRAMRRRYNATTFGDRMRRTRERVPGLNLTTDVIVGHPAESETAFAQTLRLVEAAGFTRVHVFPYSPRPGTVGGDADVVPPRDKRRRSAALRDLAEGLGAAHRAAKLGRTERVLVEDAAGGGYSADYTRFRVGGASPGQMVDATARALGDGVVLATIRP